MLEKKEDNPLIEKEWLELEEDHLKITDNTKNWVLDIIDSNDFNIWISKTQTINKIKSKVKFEINNIFKIENHLLLYILSKNHWQQFYNGFKKVLLMVGEKIEIVIIEKINEILNNEKLFYKISENEKKKIMYELKSYILDNTSNKWLIGAVVQDIQMIYRMWNKKYNEHWRLISKSKDEIKRDQQLKENIRYLFQKEWVDMSYENLFKLIQKYLKRSNSIYYNI